MRNSTPKVVNIEFFNPNTGGGLVQVKNRTHNVFKYLNIWLRSDTVSNNSSHSKPAPNESWANFTGEKGILTHNSIGCISDNNTGGPLLTGPKGESPSVDYLGLDNINAESSSGTDSIDDLSLNISRATLKDLMEGFEIQVLAGINSMMKENQKKIDFMVEGHQKEIERLDENVKDLYKKLTTNMGAQKKRQSLHRVR